MVTLYSHANNGNTPEKTCKGPCGRTLPATPEFFCRDKSGKYGLQARCKQCKSKYNAEHREQSRKSHAKWLADHEEEQKQYNKRYYEEHRDKKMQYHKEWQEKHRGYISHYNKEHKQKHHHEHVAYYKKRRAEKREELNAKYRQYRKTERGRLMHRIHENRRRARKLAASGSYTAQELQEQLKRQKSRCYYCKSKLSKNYHADHIVPISKGGSNDISNIVIACPPCNTSKNDKLLHEWLDGGRLC